MLKNSRHALDLLNVFEKDWLDHFHSNKSRFRLRNKIS